MLDQAKQKPNILLNSFQTPERNIISGVGLSNFATYVILPQRQLKSWQPGIANNMVNVFSYKVSS